MRNLSTRKKIKNGVYRPLSSRLNPQKNTETKILPTVLNIYTRYWPGVSSKWLNIGQVICCVFHRPRPRRGQQKPRKRPTINQPSWLHTRSTKDLLYCQKENVFFRDPSGAHLARSSSQSQHRIRFTLPARGFNHRCLVTLNSHIPEMLSPQDTWREKRFLLQVVMKFADIVPTRKENKNSSVLEKNKIILREIFSTPMNVPLIM